MSPIFGGALSRSMTRSPSRIRYRNIREISGTTVLFPDWPVSEGRSNDLAIVLHLGDSARLDEYLAVIADAGVAADLFVMVPDGAEIAVPASGGEVLAGDPVGGHIYQLTALINSGRLVGYRTVVRHVDDGPVSIERFRQLPLRDIDTVVHGDLDRAGIYVPSRAVDFTGDVSYRVDQLLKRVSTRFRAESFTPGARSLDTVAIRGAALELIRPVRVDHQDFYTTYFHYANEGQATEQRAGGVADTHAGAAVTSVFLTLLDTAKLRLDDVADVAGSPEVPVAARRAQAWAVYHPDLTVSRPTRNATWSHISGSIAMYVGQQMPLAPDALGFADPLRRSDRARQTELARAAGITGFLVPARWNEDGLDPAEFFSSIERDDSFPWAILLQHSVIRRINAAGRSPRQSVWADPGVDHYGALADRVAALASRGTYLTIDGRAVVLVQDLDMLDDPRAFLAALRSSFDSADNPVWIGVIEAHLSAPAPGRPTIPAGADGVVQIPPLESPMRKRMRIGGRFGGFSGPAIDVSGLVNGSAVAVEARTNADIIPGAFVGFDTTPELRSQGTVGYNWNVASFRQQLDNAVRSVAWREESRRIVVINSWNGWADMSQLEPGHHRGWSYLSAVKDTLFF